GQPVFDLARQPHAFPANHARARKFAVAHPLPDRRESDVGDAADFGLVEEANFWRRTGSVNVLAIMLLLGASCGQTCCDLKVLVCLGELRVLLGGLGSSFARCRLLREGNLRGRWFGNGHRSSLFGWPSEHIKCKGPPGASCALKADLVLQPSL